MRSGNLPSMRHLQMHCFAGQGLPLCCFDWLMRLLAHIDPQKILRFEKSVRLGQLLQFCNSIVWHVAASDLASECSTIVFLATPVFPSSSPVISSQCFSYLAAGIGIMNMSELHIPCL